MSGVKAVEQTLMEVGKPFLCCSLKTLDILWAIHGLSFALLGTFLSLLSGSVVALTYIRRIKHLLDPRTARVYCK